MQLVLVGRNADAGVLHRELKPHAPVRGSVRIARHAQPDFLVAVNFTAFPSRFTRICRSRTTSPRTMPPAPSPARASLTSGAISKVTGKPLRRASGAIGIIASATAPASGKSTASNSSFPASILEKSSTSPISDSSTVAELCAISR